MKDTDLLLAEFAIAFNELMECWDVLNSRNEDKRYIRLTKAGMSLLLKAADGCHFKDKFEAFYSYSYVLDVQIKSSKTDSDYIFGYDIIDGNLYFQAYIHNPEYIKNLQEKFLVEFFSICQRYGFKYKGQRSGTSGTSIFHNSIKSNMFRLFRDYTADVLGDPLGLDVYQHETLGYFEKKWGCTELNQDSMRQLYDELCMALKYFYRFNYNLWKAKQNFK